jgi:hypothetical protein
MHILLLKKKVSPTQEARAEGLYFKDSPGKKTPSQPIAGCGGRHPSSQLVGSIHASGQSRQKAQDPVSKITRTKRAGGVVQAVEHLPSKCKLSSKPRNTKGEKSASYWDKNLFCYSKWPKPQTH